MGTSEGQARNWAQDRSTDGGRNIIINHLLGGPDLTRWRRSRLQGCGQPIVEHIRGHEIGFRPFRNGTRERKSVSFNLPRLGSKWIPGEKQAGTEAENLGPLRKEPFSEMCNAARPALAPHRLTLNLKKNILALTYSISETRNKPRLKI